MAIAKLALRHRIDEGQANSNSMEQLIKINWLADKVIGTQFPTILDRLFVVGGNQNDRNSPQPSIRFPRAKGTLSNPTHHFKPIHIGHHHIEQN